ncbi:hypothetical protein SAY87_016428 [Trapa incisa]|uniref:Uncharacterized protein n=1 Tax=Trapa incisa TaxID=236973 RepID=A0AAN7LHF0_9MYRT|nr:hypothetical protein SAY87_016428 [Trapa incisa]
MDQLQRSNTKSGTQGEGSGGFMAVEDKKIEEEAMALQHIAQIIEDGESNSDGRRTSSANKKKRLPGFYSSASAKKIKEIFGVEEDDDGGEVFEIGKVCEPKKKKSRSLEDIYRATKPVDRKRIYISGRF